MKKLLLTTLALFPLAAFANDPNSHAHCNNIWKESPPGWVSISSEHGFTITNKSPSTLTYDIYFDNFIQYPKFREMPVDYSEPPYTQNAHSEYHLEIASGKTFQFGPVNIEKPAPFTKKMRYKTSAYTTIVYKGTILDQCVHYTNVDII
jgi:hypothetical protein